MLVGFVCEDAAHSLQGFMLWTATLFSLNVCNAFFCVPVCLSASLSLWDFVGSCGAVLRCEWCIAVL